MGARALWGCCWHPLGAEVSLSDSTEDWETPAQARLFLPWLFAQLTGKAEGNSLEWKLCGQKTVVRSSARSASLLAQQQGLVGKGSPVVTGKSAANQSLFWDGHTAAGAGSWRPRAVGLVQGVQKNCHRQIPAPTGERALETGTRLLNSSRNSSRVSQERERPWAKRLTAD